MCEQCGKQALHYVDDAMLCAKHYEYLKYDIIKLLGNRRQITCNMAVNWLDTNKDNSNLMFINGYFNEFPTELYLSENILNKINVCNFATRNGITRK